MVPSVQKNRRAWRHRLAWEIQAIRLAWEHRMLFPRATSLTARFHRVTDSKTEPKPWQVSGCLPTPYRQTQAMHCRPAAEPSPGSTDHWTRGPSADRRIPVSVLATDRSAAKPAGAETRRKVISRQPRAAQPSVVPASMPVQEDCWGSHANNRRELQTPVTKNRPQTTALKSFVAFLHP